MRKQLKVAIVDYGVGNLRSLSRALEYHGASVLITEEPKDIEESDALVLPGDGAFAAGMDGLEVRKLKKVIVDFAKSGKPVLGICLGAQILLSDGYEFGHHKGLNLIAGKVVRFPKLKRKEKIPQIGWNAINVGKRDWKNTILAGIKLKANVYFVHSYIIEPENKKNIVATTSYGGVDFCSVIGSDNIWGCQFHPEKSGDVGLAIIKNFLKITRTHGKN